MLLPKLIIPLLVTFGSSAVYAGMSGGYSSISVTDPQVKNVANFATRIIDNGSLKRIVSAESQVVAGINYKLMLEIIDLNGFQHNYNVTVFVPLPSSNESMQVTNASEVLAY